MTHPEGRVPAGWYPDPTGLAQLRWWDDHGWTDQTTDRREPVVPRETIVIKPHTVWAEPGNEQANEAPTELAEADEVLVYERHESTTAPPLPWEETKNIAEPQVSETSTSGTEHSGTEWRQATSTARAAQSDWSQVSVAIHSATLPLAPTLIAVTAEDMPPLLIDIGERAYWWDVNLDDFPASAAGLQLNVGYPGEIPTPFNAGQPMEPLLWAVGTASFAGAAAPWLESDGRYKLRRWPNLTSMAHTSDQLHLTSILGQAHLTASELAAVAQSTLEEAQTLINTYSLMGLLRQLPGSTASNAAPVMRAPMPEQPSERGLFSRLRSRLGL